MVGLSGVVLWAWRMWGRLWLGEAWLLRILAIRGELMAFERRRLVRRRWESGGVVLPSRGGGVRSSAIAESSVVLLWGGRCVCWLTQRASLLIIIIVHNCHSCDLSFLAAKRASVFLSIVLYWVKNASLVLT